MNEFTEPMRFRGLLFYPVFLFVAANIQKKSSYYSTYFSILILSLCLFIVELVKNHSRLLCNYTKVTSNSTFLSKRLTYKQVYAIIYTEQGKQKTLCDILGMPKKTGREPTTRKDSYYDRV